MAGKALVAFSLLATLLQVRAHVFCYPTADCDASRRFNTTSVHECCVGDLTVPRGYAHHDGSSACRACVVYSISDVSVGESRGPVTLEVSLKVGTLDQNVDINYKTQEISPNTSNVDYTKSTGTLTLDSSATVNTFTIDILEDELVEVDEVFQVVLEPVNGDVVLLHDSATVTIEDDDGQMAVTLITATVISERLGVFEYRLVSDKPWGSPMEVHIFTSTENESGFAQEGEDYEPLNKNVTMTLGDSLTRYYEENLVDDNYYEKTYEKFYIHMDVLEPFSSKIVLKNTRRTTSIKDDDDLVIGFKNLVYAVGEGEGSLEFEVEPKTNVQLKVPVSFSLLDHQGSARKGSDYNIEEGKDELELLPGETNVYRITILEDDEVELNETFTLSLSTSQSRVTINPNFNRTVVTIVDNDVLTVQLRTELNSVAEERLQPLSVSVHALGSVPAPVVLVVSSVSHSKDHYATAGEDYVSFSIPLTLMSGENPSNSTTLTILDDRLLEPYEEVIEIKMELAARSPFTRVMLMSTPRNVTILDNDEVEIGFNSVSYNVKEGDGSFVFDVEVKNNVSFGTPIVYTLSDNEGEALRNKDYIVKEIPERHLNPGQMSVRHTVQIIADNQTERLHETFTIDLATTTERVGVAPSFDQLTATITDDDDVTIDVDEFMPNVLEDDGPVEICLSVVKGELAVDKNVTLVVQTVDGTASAPDDYEAINGNLTILTKDNDHACFNVTIKQDDDHEQNETFSVMMTFDDPSVTLELGEIEITITNDDKPPEDDLNIRMQVPESVNENGGDFTVSLIASRGVAQEVKLLVRTVPSSMSGSAEVGEDYIGINESVTLGAWKTSVEINVTVINDNFMEELEEVFEIKVKHPQPDTLPFKVNLIDDHQEIRIEDDDAVQIGFNQSSYTAYEENGYFTFGVELKGTVMSAIPIEFTVTDVQGTAISDEDYEGLTAELTLVPEQTSYGYSILIFNDFKAETDETFKLVLRALDSRVTIPPGLDEVTVTIIDGPSARIGFERTAYSFKESGATILDPHEVCVSIFEGSVASVTVLLQSVAETATEEEDYEPVSQVSVTLTSQEPSECVTIVIKKDEHFEAHETFAIELTSTDSSVLLQPAETQITIRNDDRLLLEMHAVQAGLSETKENVTIVVNADRNVETHVNVRLYTAPSERNPTATEGQDFARFNETVPLALGSAVTSIFMKDLLLDDNVLEKSQEYFSIWMEVPKQPMFDMIDIVANEDHDVVAILDAGEVVFGFTRKRYTVNEKSGNVTVEIELKDDFTTEVVLPFTLTVTPGSAHNNTDFKAPKEVKLQFNPGEKIVRHTIGIVSDVTPENDETFNLSLSHRRARVALDPNFTQAEVLITEVVRATVGFVRTVYTVPESASHANVCLRILDGTLASNKNITVMLESLDGTATASSDYTAVSQTIVLTSQSQESCVNVEITQDPTLEMNETFTMRLTTNMKNVTLDPAQTEIIILNEDAVNVTFDAAKYTYQESSGQATVTVIFTGDTAVPVHVNVIGEPSEQTTIGEDRVSFFRQLTFTGSGPTAETVAATIEDDEIALEDDEIVNVGIIVVSPIPGVNVELRTTVVTIIDDDPLSAFFNKSEQTVREDIGMVEICVNKSLPTIPALQFGLQSSDGSATAGSDYIGLTNSMITIAGKDMYGCHSVVITNDTEFEDTEENFFVELSYLGPSDSLFITLGLNETEIKIIDDDGVRVSFSSDHYEFQESVGMAVVEVVLTGDTALDIVVSVKGGPSDQTTVAPGKVVFTEMTTFTADGPKTKNVFAVIPNDEIALEDDELVNVVLDIVSPTTGAHFGMFQTTVVTIIDDDSFSTDLEQSEVKVNESVGTAEICLRKSHRTIPDLVFDLQSRDGSATAGSDYVGLKNPKITIDNNDTRGCLSVGIIDDTQLEHREENFFVDLSYSGNRTVALGQSETEVTIVDNDGVRVSFTSDHYTYKESEGMAFVEIVLTGDTARDVVVSVKGGPSDQTTVAPGKVVFTEMTITFTADGPKTKNVSALIPNDEVALEDDELVNVVLDIVSPATGVDLGMFLTTVVTIVDDDPFSAYLEQSELKVNESVGTAEICLRKSLRTIPDLVFDLQSRDGSATAGSDYVGLTNAKIPMNNNETHGCLSVDIIEDIRLEQLEESFFVDLSYSGNHTVALGQIETEVTIVDNDVVLVGFKKGQYTYNESDGRADVVVVLNGETDLDITVSITGGPSNQANIGDDRVEFNHTVTFTPVGSKEITVSTTVTDDGIALEAPEIVDVSLSIVDPKSRVNFDALPATLVTILDDDPLIATFTTSEVQVNEKDGTVAICVEMSHQAIQDVEFAIDSHDGTATAGVDYNLLDSTITVQAYDDEECFPSVEIVDDEKREAMENFHVTLSYSGAEAVSVAPPSSIEFFIHDGTPPTQKCILSQDLILYPFSQYMSSDNSFSMDQGCEHTLVKTCEGSTPALEIRVDFYQNNFTSTKVAISFEGERVIINEDLSVRYDGSGRILVNQSEADNTVLVSIPEIELTVIRNTTDLMVTFGEVDIQLSGLCGNLNETLVFPDCDMKFEEQEQLDSFIRSYKIKPSDQILRRERMECGGTTKDTVIHDPVMIVPVHAPGFDSDINLCYEIHGDADKYFNLVSDGCTSVNAHYSQAPAAEEINIIDSISVVAVDNQGICHQISVDVAGCLATVDGQTLQPMSKKRSTSTSDMNGISVRSYSSRARITVPNCEDNKLVMWVICEYVSVYDGHNDVYTDPMNMIKFEITRGLNLHEYSHGLLGQFWNIPVAISFHTEIDGAKYYNVTVSHPSSEPRSFSGLMHHETWDSQQKQCLYVGNLQGGPTPEVPELDDSVIEGLYTDYVVDSKFETQFTYAVFVDKCGSTE